MRKAKPSGTKSLSANRLTSSRRSSTHLDKLLKPRVGSKNEWLRYVETEKDFTANQKSTYPAYRLDDWKLQVSGLAGEASFNGSFTPGSSTRLT